MKPWHKDKSCEEIEQMYDENVEEYATLEKSHEELKAIAEKYFDNDGSRGNFDAMNLRVVREEYERWKSKNK